MNEDGIDRNKYNLSPSQKTVIAPVSSDMVALSEKKAEEDAKIYTPPTEEELEAKRIAEEEKKKAEQEKKEAYIDPLANFQADNDKEDNLTTTKNISNTNQTEPHASLFGAIAGTTEISIEEKPENTQKNIDAENSSIIDPVEVEAPTTTELSIESQSPQEIITVQQPTTLSNSSKVYNKEKISIILAYTPLLIHLSVFYLPVLINSLPFAKENYPSILTIIFTAIITITYAIALLSFIVGSIIGIKLGRDYKKATGNKSIGIILNLINLLSSIAVIISSNFFRR